MIYAKVIEDSISNGGHRLTTLECSYPRFIHSEVMTHRVFSRNAMSSRAIPVAKMIEQVRTNPAAPIHWGANQPGMQAHQEVANTDVARTAWKIAAGRAADDAEFLNTMGLHKQVVNRILEPFQWMRTIISATEWDNFFALRAHPDAQPEFQALAVAMRNAMAGSSPVHRGPGTGFASAGWHLPYVLAGERMGLPADTLTKISAARCARVSYLTHDGDNPSIDKDLTLFDRLVGSSPMHASPIEHQAMPGSGQRNFVGWKQLREFHEARYATGGILP